MAKHLIHPRLVEIQCYLDRYFNQNIAPRLSAAIRKVNAHRAAQMDKDTSLSFAHTMTSLRTARIGLDDTQVIAMHKAYEGYNKEILQEFTKTIRGDKSLQKDLAKISTELRVHLLEQLSHRYGSKEAAFNVLNRVSLANGQDIVSTYVSEVMSEKAVNSIAAKQMPRSAFEYITRHGFCESIYGVMLFPSDDIGDYVNQRIEKKYQPSCPAKASVTSLTSVLDTGLLAGSAAVTYLVGIALDNVTRFGLNHFVVKTKGNVGYVDAASVLGNIYNGSKTAFSYAEKKGAEYNPNQSVYIRTVNQQMSRKVKGIHPLSASPTVKTVQTDKITPSQAHHTGKVYHDRVGNSAAYLSPSSASSQPSTSTLSTPVDNQTGGQSHESSPHLMGNADGWQDIFSKAAKGLGLDGFSDIHQNIGYVLAMLPDMMLGMFSGKNPNMKLEDNVLPLAAIMGGLFVKNPILKLMLLGLGGANILNHAGHAALTDAGIGPSVRYKKYADEPLNRRMGSPKLQGNTLVFTVDGVPTVATVSNMVVDAYHQGALPLNTIANEVLKKYDEQQVSSPSYAMQEKEEHVEQRSRGMK